jgi:hypothetical protein
MRLARRNGAAGGRSVVARARRAACGGQAKGVQGSRRGEEQHRTLRACRGRPVRAGPGRPGQSVPRRPGPASDASAGMRIFCRAVNGKRRAPPGSCGGAGRPASGGRGIARRLLQTTPSNARKGVWRDGARGRRKGSTRPRPAASGAAGGHRAGRPRAAAGRRAPGRPWPLTAAGNRRRPRGAAGAARPGPPSRRRSARRPSSQRPHPGGPPHPGGQNEVATRAPDSRSHSTRPSPPAAHARPPASESPARWSTSDHTPRQNMITPVTWLGVGFVGWLVGWVLVWVGGWVGWLSVGLMRGRGRGGRAGWP